MYVPVLLVKYVWVPKFYSQAGSSSSRRHLMKGQRKIFQPSPRFGNQVSSYKCFLGTWDIFPFSTISSSAEREQKICSILQPFLFSFAVTLENRVTDHTESVMCKVLITALQNCLNRMQLWRGQVNATIICSKACFLMFCRGWFITATQMH